jgi:hypothetical protein
MGAMERVRWGNVLRALAVVGVLGLVVAWPLLAPEAPRVPRALVRPVVTPSAVAPAPPAARVPRAPPVAVGTPPAARVPPVPAVPPAAAPRPPASGAPAPPDPDPVLREFGPESG